MAYFRYFPRDFYRFGDEESTSIFSNISAYAEVVDSIRDNVAFFQDYYIQEGTRPDQVSYELYNTPQYHWTLYLMNPILRERGWPLSNREVIRCAQRACPGVTIVTRNSIFDKMLVGQLVHGNTSAAEGVVTSRVIDLGLINVRPTLGTFISGEQISSTGANDELEIITATSITPEYLAPFYYKNAAGETVDIDPLVGPGALLTEVTRLDHGLAKNEELKSIKVIKPSSIRQVVRSFREAVAS